MKNDPVFTASMQQVRQPLYHTPLGRWRAFEQFLAPLRPVLRADAQ